MFQPGERLGDRYVLRERLGAGGMAVVWAAEDTRLRRPVAVKVLREGGDDLARRLRRESRVLAGLHHPAIVDVYDAGEWDGCPYVVLELVEGETLADRLRRDRVLPADEVAVLGAALADGLAHAHELGIVHRDVKPSNVLVSPDGRPRLVDFGIARQDDATRITSTGLGMGTAAYASPEQLEGGSLGPSTDVYSLGLVLAEALLGRGVFHGAPAVAVLTRLRDDPDLSEVPEAWVPLLGAMTRREPADRPTAASVATALVAAPTSAPVAATAPLDEEGAPTQPLTTAALGVALAGTEPLATAPFEVTGAATEPVAATAPVAAGPMTLGALGGGFRARRPLWLALAAVVLVLGLAVGWGLAGGDGETVKDEPQPAGATTTATVPTTAAPTTAPTTTAAPPVTSPAPPAADPGNGTGNGHGNGRGHQKPKKHGH